jgi:hypothetical protein
MISHSKFGKLRLAQFIKSNDVAEVDNWEFNDRIWLGEAFGFSEWLRLKDDPNILRYLALDFTDFPKTQAAMVLNQLGIEILPGMGIEQVNGCLGKCNKVTSYATDRKTFDYTVGSLEKYEISCTILIDGGLTYLGMMQISPGRDA